MTTYTTTHESSRHGQSVGKYRRLKNGAEEGQLVRVYREHQMRFARAIQVNAKIGFGPNVLVHYLDGDQEEEKLYGNIVQPVDDIWLQAMKVRLNILEQEFRSNNVQGVPKGQRVDRRKRLKSGVKEGALVRVYREHYIRFGYATEIDAGPGFGPNVAIRYLDSEPGDQTWKKVYGNIVQPVDRAWLEDMKVRFRELERAFDTEQAALN